MIVLHVARARTDSINIRGSLGKTRAALWITGATFLYFSGCNAHTPFTLFSFLCLSRLPLSFPSGCFPFAIFPYLSSFLFYPRVMSIAVHVCHGPLRSLSLFLTHLHPQFSLVEQMETRHSRTVSLFSNCYSLDRNGNCSRFPYSRN